MSIRKKVKKIRKLQKISNKVIITYINGINDDIKNELASLKDRLGYLEKNLSANNGATDIIENRLNDLISRVIPCPEGSRLDPYTYTCHE